MSGLRGPKEANPQTRSILRFEYRCWVCFGVRHPDADSLWIRICRAFGRRGDADCTLSDSAASGDSCGRFGALCEDVPVAPWKQVTMELGVLRPRCRGQCHQSHPNRMEAQQRLAPDGASLRSAPQVKATLSCNLDSATLANTLPTARVYTGILQTSVATAKPFSPLYKSGAKCNKLGALCNYPEGLCPLCFFYQLELGHQARLRF